MSAPEKSEIRRLYERMNVPLASNAQVGHIVAGLELAERTADKRRAAETASIVARRLEMEEWFAGERAKVEELVTELTATVERQKAIEEELVGASAEKPRGIIARMLGFARAE